MRPGRLVTVQHDVRVLDAVRVMTASDVRIVSVLQGNRFVGVLSERDVVRRVVGRELDPSRARVGDVMTRNVIVADPDDDCASALRRMEEAGIGHLPVMSEGYILSMLSIRDLLVAEREARAAAPALKDRAAI